MKRTLLILFFVIAQIAAFSQGDVVVLTNNKPAYIPSYLIIEGNLYFKTNVGYTSLGDTLLYYVSKADSSELFYTPRQIDSVLLTINQSQWIDVDGGIEYDRNVNVEGTFSLNDTLLTKWLETHGLDSLNFKQELTVRDTPIVNLIREHGGAAIPGLDNEILLSDGSGGLKSSSYFGFDGTRLTTHSGISTKNVLIGFEVANGISSEANTMIGYATGFNSTDARYNVFVGNNSGYNNIGGDGNTFTGCLSGYSNTSGTKNVCYGYNSGFSNLTGQNNAYFGHYTGYYSTGQNNTFIGSMSGYLNTTGQENTFVGSGAGWNHQTGFGNIFLGYRAGYNETGSQKLYIESSNSATPLIGGDFATDKVQINFTLNLGALSVYPLTPTEGDIIRLCSHATDPNGVYIYNGSSWASIITW
jgi:hypothetical protein